MSVDIVKGEALRVRFRQTAASDLGVYELDIAHQMHSGDVDLLCQKLVPHVEGHTHKFALHVKHVDTSELQPPSMKCMLDLCARVLAHEALSRRMRGCVVQGRVVDDVVTTARNLFLTFYDPRGGLECVDSDEAAQGYLKQLVDKRLARAARRAQ